MSRDPSSHESPEPSASSDPVDTETSQAPLSSAEEQAQRIAEESLDPDAGHAEGPTPTAATAGTDSQVEGPRSVTPPPATLPPQEQWQRQGFDSEQQPGYAPQGQSVYQQQGYPQQGQHHPHSPAPTVAARNPVLYVLIDLLVTGLGLILQGRALLGVTFLGITFFCLVFSWIPILGWFLVLVVMLPLGIISMVLSYNTAKNWNRRHGIIS